MMSRGENMVSRKETVSVQIDEIIPYLIGVVKEAFDELPEGTKFVYTSKTRFLTFDVIRPDGIDEG